MQQGILYESMNMAALWDLPVLFVCINNQYGMGTRIDRATRNVAFEQRAEAFGLEAAMVDGEDAEEVFATAQTLLEKARAGRPGYMAVSCYRFYGHGRKDKSPYRSPEEEDLGRKRDPVARARANLITRGLTSEADLDALDAKVGEEMAATIDFTIAAEPPPPNAMFRDVYGKGEPEPEPLQTRLDRILARA